MTRYVLRDGRCVNKATGEPMEKPYRLSAPQVVSDLPAYASPLGDGVVEGRAARREHLKRNGCREVDPGEFKPTYLNEAVARRMGREWNSDAARERADRQAEQMRDRLNEAAQDTANLMYDNRS